MQTGEWSADELDVSRDAAVDVLRRGLESAEQIFSEKRKLNTCNELRFMKRLQWRSLQRSTLLRTVLPPFYLANPIRELAEKVREKSSS